MSSERRNLPFVEGALAGVGAWALGYVLTYLVVAPDIRDSPLNRIIEAFDGAPATYEMVGWVFYNAHFVDTVFRNIPLLGTESASFVGGDGGFTPILYAVPVALLFLAGLGLAVYRGEDDASDGALAGVTVVPGYAVLSIAGVFLTEVTIGGATGGPDLVAAVFLAGLVYPAALGAVGGVAGSVLRAR